MLLLYLSYGYSRKQNETKRRIMGQLLSSLGSRGGEMTVPEVTFDIESKCIANELIYTVSIELFGNE